MLSATLYVISAEAEPALGNTPFPAISRCLLDGTALALVISACPSRKLDFWMKAIAIRRARRVHADLTFRTTFCSCGDATFIVSLLDILFSIQLEVTAPFFPVRAGKSFLRSFGGGPACEIGHPLLPHIKHLIPPLLEYDHPDLGLRHCLRCPGFPAVTLGVCTKVLAVQLAASQAVLLPASNPAVPSSKPQQRPRAAWRGRNKATPAPPHPT